MNQDDFSPDVGNLPFVEELYTSYLKDPSSVGTEWRQYFDGLTANEPSAAYFQPGPTFQPGGLFNPMGLGRVAAAPVSNGQVVSPPEGGAPVVESLRMAVLQDRVDQLIRAFRVRGHLSAQIDPLGRPSPEQPELTPEFYGFSEEDLDRPFSTRTIKGAEVRTLRRIVDRLRNTYCRSIGVQFMHIDELRVRHWLQERMEGSENRLEMSRDDQLRTLHNLTNAVIFEEFLHKKFRDKRFSLEGAETLIPLLDLAIESAGEQGLQDVILAMAHRGRLNVLANIMGKSPKAIFREFEDPDPYLNRGRGDVKYHLGYSRDWQTITGKELHLSLCFNPSHLEFVDPVALGRVRAKQDRKGDLDRERSMAIIVHGDASFAGEGVVQETFNMSQTAAYETGGTLHVIVNNQLGFTTLPEEGRSTQYASDVAKMLQIPIFHVNGEDPEAVAQVVKLSMEFRKEFKRDVVIDMYCYRKYGHNEGDEPEFTQPVMYQHIAKRKGVREHYVERLQTLGEITDEEADRIAEQRRDQLQQELSMARSDDFAPPKEKSNKIWASYYGGPESEAVEVDTTVALPRLKELLTKLATMPADFRPHQKLERILLQARTQMAAGEKPLDWGTGEQLAFASLAVEGFPVRMSGQDVERGTFSHRHAVLHDYGSERTYEPLQHLDPNQAPVMIYNSTLSETGVLGFEYGYSLDCPDGLVMWEAQFGDFCNAAQVIIDQFIVSAEDKWRRLSGLVLLLPHGFEGQGPEHSSARLERFLMLAAEDNIQVVNPTTPAQYFHLLRRQVLRHWRKPLIVMTPKSGLRHPRAVSTLEELARGSFRQVLPDLSVEPAKAERVLICSGKIYFDLEAERESRGRDDVAILRLEQLYPLGPTVLEETLNEYAAGTPVLWVQEEPENMGAWRFLRCRYGESISGGRHPFSGISRAASASPATGSKSSHKLEQKEIMDAAFDSDPLTPSTHPPVKSKQLA